MGETAAPEIWFYHLERSTLDQVLPELLDRTLRRGWRAQIRVTEPRLMEQIDERLWTWRDESFLAHGLAEAPHAGRQPILLTSGDGGLNPNGAQALFIVDDAEIGELEGWTRCFIIFDGQDDAALTGARERWRTLKAAGADLAYWKQTDEGWLRAA
ncbi:DNA polymerase III subunit chi [Brevundimonas sp. VNH65]|uniref:DNA polymerase III subunit chi n=1 Tax=Brevundimonas sp. VNH65 TaxID=3400917 RepID=UPI003BFD791D